ncbi:MAG TPA: hypothetical protein DEQ30_14680 [Porphyromonadaceae bacterium]|nr:hypothetical protein [Porphyromonadaceae bacterium]
MLNLLPLAHINAKFILDGKNYDVEHFRIGLAQPTDHKGQPQHEIKGGQINITLSHIADDNLYQWAKTSTLTKGGTVLFQTDLGITVLCVIFENAYCINLLRDIDAVKGSSTTLTISAEKISLNGLEHDNFWPDK